MLNIMITYNLTKINSALWFKSPHAFLLCYTNAKYFKDIYNVRISDLYALYRKCQLKTFSYIC